MSTVPHCSRYLCIFCRYPQLVRVGLGGDEVEISQGGGPEGWHHQDVDCTRVAHKGRHRHDHQLGLLELCHCESLSDVEIHLVDPTRIAEQPICVTSIISAKKIPSSITWFDHIIRDFKILKI